MVRSIIPALWVTGALILFAAACVRSDISTTPVPDPEEQARVLQAEDQGLVNDGLLAATRSADRSTRAMAAMALGRIGDRTCFDILVKMLHDPATTVRLLPLVRDSSPQVREQLAFSLGLLGGRDNIEVLLELIRDETPQVAVRACLAIAGQTEPDAAVPDLTGLLDAPNQEIRRAAATALASIARINRSNPNSAAGAEARQALVSHSGIQDSDVVLQIVRGLYPPRNESEKGLLIRLFQHPNRQIQIQVLQSLSYTRGPIDPILASINSEDFHLVQTSLTAMGRNGEQSLVDILQEFSGDRNPTALRIAAIQAFRRANPQLAAFELPIQLVDSPIAALRAEAAKTAAVFRHSRNTAIVARLLSDSSPEVRAAAIQAAALPDGFLADLLAPVWEDPEPEVRRGLAKAAGSRLEIRRSGRTFKPAYQKEAIELLGRIWDLSNNDSQEFVRSAVLDALAAAVRDPAGETLLKKAAGHHDYRSRSRAIAVLEDKYDVDLPAGAGPASDLPLDHYVEMLHWAQTGWEAVVTMEREGFAPGTFTILLDTRNAPRTCWRFAQLAEKGFYDGLQFHRLIPNFLIQGGDPRMDGLGDPGDSIYPEYGSLPFEAGTVAMLEGPEAGAGSQFFISLTAQRRLDGKQIAFGRVDENLVGVVNLLIPGDTIVGIRIQAAGGEATPGQPASSP